MKKLAVFVIFLSVILAGCRYEAPSQITATTLPVYEFTGILCKNTGITVSRLVTENVSCLHDYTLQVSQMRTLSAAQTVVISGAGLEDFLDDTLSHANHIIDASAALDLDDLHAHTHMHQGHSHAHDPHIWLSPKNAMQMSITICTGLSVQYPEYKSVFESNLNDLLAQLEALQQYGEYTLKNLRCRDLITFHDGFGYFADSFDLHILKAVEEESGSEASAKELIQLIQLTESNDLPAIFTETNGSTAAAAIIAAETGVSVYTLDMAMSGNSYFDAMYRNIDTVKEALG